MKVNNKFRVEVIIYVKNTMTLGKKTKYKFHNQLILDCEFGMFSEK